MLMVCVLHVNGRSGSLAYAASQDVGFRLGVWGSEVFCLVAVNLYAMVTGYVCVLGSWKPSRYFRLWMQVAFYTVGYFVLRELLVQGGFLEASPLSWKRYVRAFLPIPFADVYWYFTAYTALFLLIPFLNPWIRGMNASALRVLLFLFFAVFSCSVLIEGDGVYAGGCNSLWLVVLYIAGAYVRLHGVRVPVCFLLAGVVVSIIVATAYAFWRESVNISYVLPPTILSSVCMFLFFERLKIQNAVVIKVVAVLSPLTFGVYLAHVHPCTWSAMGRYFPRIFESCAHAWWLYLALPLALYLACSLLDTCRAWLFRLCRANALADAMEHCSLYLWNTALSLLQKRVGSWFPDTPGQP